jgi:glycosyltransferase involved in cell wall biosynthesis
MAGQQIQISLVVSTRGRTTELERLFDTLSRQDHRSFEVLIVDQNSDERLAALVLRPWPFPVTHIHRPGERGLSRGRNIGWRAAKGELVVFPDDDCWYPPWFLSRAANELTALDASILTGRAADESGRGINGRYLKSRERIDRSNVWIAGIEWVMVFRKSVLAELEGFDENIGVGADTPWQACEGQDLLLRALDAGRVCYFDPALFGHHEELDTQAPDTAMIRKGRAYGRGLGYVLRVHDFPMTNALVWIVRPILNSGFNLLKGNIRRCAYLLHVSLGRLEGYCARTWNHKTS